MDFIRRNKYVSAVCVLALLLGGYFYLFAPPQNFPTGQTVSIAQGAALSEVAHTLADAHVIRHPSVLSLLLRISGASARIQAGTYLLDKKENTLTIAYRLIRGDYRLLPVSVTFPEGDTVRDMREKVATALSPAVASDLLLLGKPQEGYLFPDTYRFSPDTTAESILKTMRENFDAKTAPLLGEVQASGHTLADVITLASLVEKEARTEENRRIVAGVLWNRLARKMPLQVDAVFGYINNRDTYSPSLADLTVDSPYNTYKHTGLPPGPICNPGMMSILAALHPTKTNYLFYLTDKNGVMHYTTTYAAHQANQEKYLR